MKITRDTMRADGKTVGEAMDDDAAFLRSIGIPCQGGQPTVDERVEAFTENMRRAVLDALDTCSPTGKGWADKDLTPLFAAIDKHAENLFWRLYFEGKVSLNKISDMSVIKTGKIIPLYKCPECGKVHNSEANAIACLNSDDVPVAKVGDIVEIKYGFGWFDGSKNWVINPEIEPWKKHGFGPEESWGFYYVVTHIDRHDHRTRYHVATGAMTGEQGHRGGYTYNEGHHTPRVIAAPPAAVVKESKQLIGLKFDELI